MYDPSPLTTGETHTLQELHDKLIARAKSLDREKYIHRFADGYGHFNTLSQGLVPAYPPQAITDMMNIAKRKNKPSWSIEQWYKFCYSSKFRSLRDKWLSNIHAIDDAHVRGDTNGGIKSIDRFHYKDVSYEWFVDNYERPSKPCMISGFADDWGLNSVTYKTLYDSSTLRNEPVKVGKDDDGRAVRVPLDKYLQYCVSQTDDSPVYLFESQLDRTAALLSLTKLYSRPEWFQSDLFDFCHPERRPPHRWFCIGPERSGTTMHVDPLGTNAWNTVIAGRKLWIILPPHVPEDIATGEFCMKNGFTSDEKPILDEAVGWYDRVYPKLKQWCLEQGNNVQLQEFIQYPGETIFVPGSWWHFVINLDDTLAVTQNYSNMSNFATVWTSMRVERKHTAQRWIAMLRKRFPKAAQLAQQLDQQDSFLPVLYTPSKTGTYRLYIEKIESFMELHGKDSITPRQKLVLEQYYFDRSEEKPWSQDELPKDYRGWEEWSGSDDSSTDSSDDDSDDDEDDEDNNKKPSGNRNKRMM